MSAEEAGLVHTSNNSADRPMIICSCCPCCCTILRGRTQLGNLDAFAPSRFEAEVVSELCNGCGICSDRRCFWCRSPGRRQGGCGSGEMHRLRPVRERVPGEGNQAQRAGRGPEIPKTAIEMAMKVMQEKGTLERFMHIMQR